MANEINLGVQLTASKNGAAVNLVNSGQNITMSGNEMGDETQLIGTSAEALTLGELSTSAGPFIAIVNLDATNYVEISSDASVATPLIKLKPAERCVFPASATIIYAKANTASVRVRKGFVER